jgi:Bacterial regulatory protein, Fis family
MTADELVACMDELILRLRQDCGLSVQEIEQLFEKGLVRHVLDATHGNVSKAALLYGKHRNGLARQMKKFGFDISQWDRRGSRGPRLQHCYESILTNDQPERGLSQ